MKKFIEIMLWGSSLQNLQRVGSADREIEYYHLFSPDYEVILFEYSCGDNTTDYADAPRIDTTPTYFKNKLLQSTAGALLAAMWGEAPEAIRTKQFWGSWAGVFFKWVTHKPLIIRMGYVWSHTFILERGIKNAFLIGALRTLERIVLSQADAVICTTPEIRKYFAVNPIPFEVIPNGVSNRRFSYKKTPKAYDFIFVGRLIKIKNIEELINGIPDSYSLLIIGDGPEKSLLDDRANTDWIGMVANNNLPSYLRTARCFVSLSKSEGHPKAVLEAIFCGCYPILSDIPAHRRMINELGYGSLVKTPAAKTQIRTILDNAKILPKELLSFKRKYSMYRLVKREIAYMNSISVPGKNV